MNESRSLDALTTQFMSNSDMEQLSLNDRKFIMNQLKKLYSQQMSKVAAQITKRNQVKTNKNDIQQKEEQQIKSIHENLIMKMDQHNKKKQKAFNKKMNHFKLLDENWKIKLEQIQRKKKEQYKKSLQKAAKYRKEAETFWTENKQKNKSIIVDQSIPIIQNDGYFSIRTQLGGVSNKHLKPKAQQFYENKRKTQSKNDLPNVNKTLLPNIQKKSYYLSTHPKKNNVEKIPMHQSFHKIVDQKSIYQHIEKSKHINTEKQQFALQKALQKMKMIELKRKKCRQDRQKNIKQAKLKRQLREETIAQAQRRQRIQQQNQVKTSKQKRKDRRSLNVDSNQNMHLSRSRSKNQGSFSLSESIVKHKRAKQQLQEHKFQQRGEVLKINIMNQKKAKMIRMVKQKINKMKHQALKEA